MMTAIPRTTSTEKQIYILLENFTIIHMYLVYLLGFNFILGSNFIFLCFKLTIPKNIGNKI